MRTPRIFLSPLLPNVETVNLEAKTSHYLQHVLRLPVGAQLQVFDGQGKEYQAQITKVDKQTVQIAIGQLLVKPVESVLKIHLLQALAKGEKMDWVVQKAVELGVNSITLLTTERSEVKLSAERFIKRIQHLQAVAISACEQCGRSVVPRINPPQELTQWLNKAQYTKCCALHPGGEMHFSKDSLTTDVSLMIGPEGGWSERELALFAARQIPLFSLGPRILRTETAAMAAIAIAQYQWGDLGGV